MLGKGKAREIECEEPLYKCPAGGEVFDAEDGPAYEEDDESRNDEEGIPPLGVEAWDMARQETLDDEKAAVVSSPQHEVPASTVPLAAEQKDNPEV